VNPEIQIMASVPPELTPTPVGAEFT